MSQQSEQIDKFLDNQMSKDERSMFEQQLRSDKKIAEELAFQKELRSFFKKRNPALKEELKDLGNEFFQEPKPKSKTPTAFIVALLAIASVVAYFVFPFSSEEPTNNKTQDSTIEETIEPQVDNPAVTEPKSAEENIPSTKSAEETVSGPFAALEDEAIYKRNPLIEQLITEDVRGKLSKSKTSLEIPKPNAVLDFSDALLFEVKGSTTQSPNYRLSVFSNKTYEIENNYPVMEMDMNGFAQGDEYRFSFSGTVPFEKGLYYLFVKGKDNGEILHISRFKVK